MSDDEIKRIPIKELRQEEGASELVSSPDMEPYLEYIMAWMQGADVQPHLEALSKLFLEKRAGQRHAPDVGIEILQHVG